ncbi:MAG: tetratricopeptide repeat protein [Hyphomicrobiaceae bacterium]
MAVVGARATPLDGHDCYSKDIMRRIEGCAELLKLPHLAPSVRAQAFALRALALSLIRRYDEAIADYDRSLAIQPNHAVTLNNRAWALYKSGRIAEALPDVEKSLRRDNSSPHAFDTRAHVRQARGEAAAAYRDYRRAMELGGTKMVRLYQCGLQAYGLYQGPISGISSISLDNALRTCVKRTDCDPLPPDEECKAALS